MDRQFWKQRGTARLHEMQIWSQMTLLEERRRRKRRVERRRRKRGERNTRPCYIDARLNGVPAGEAGAQVVGRVEGGREGRTECGRHCSGLEGRRDREED